MSSEYLWWLCSLLQPLRWPYVECVIHHERDVREEKHHIYVARTSNNGVIAAHDLYCCLLSQCEALGTCRSGFSDRNKKQKFVVKKRGCCRGLSVALNVRFTANGMCAKNNTQIYVAGTSNNRVIPMEWSWWVTSNNACEPGEQLTVLPDGNDESDLVGWTLLLAATVWSEALPTCCSVFPIATKWRCDQDVKVVLCETFTQNVRSMRFVAKMRGCCCNLSIGLALNVWFTTNGMCAKKNTRYMWGEQAIIDWLRRMFPIVACCHSAKLCAHAARAFPIATSWTRNRL